MLDTLQYMAAVVAVENPLEGITPDFSVFGAEFDSLWKKIMGAIWALAILWAVVNLVIALATMARSQGGHPQQLQESRTSAAWAGVVLGALAAFGVIVGAILAVFS